MDEVIGGSWAAGVVRARAELDDLEAAVERLANCLNRPGIVLGLVFCSPLVDPRWFIRTLQDRCPAVMLVGCTTAGEIDHLGVHRKTCVAMGLGWKGLRVAPVLSRDLSARPMAAGRAATRAMAGIFGLEPEDLDASCHVALSLVDGLVHCQESFAVGSAAEAPAITFVGASSADLGSGFHPASVFFDGAAHSNAAVVLGLETDLPFAAFVAEGGEPTSIRAVVTAAVPARRLVFELNGKPALQEYREICTRAGYSLDRALAAPVPFGYYVAGRHHLRSVVGVEGNALRFGSAIDVGSVLRLMQPTDLIDSTRIAIADARVAVGGEVRAVLAFQSVARYRELAARSLCDEFAAVVADEPVIGFNTFGEQINLLHINHSVTGLVIGGGASDGR